MVSSASKRKHLQAKKPDNDNEKENENENVIVNEKENDNELCAAWFCKTVKMIDKMGIT